MSVPKTTDPHRLPLPINADRPMVGALQQYEKVLAELTYEPTTFLSVLIVRDQIDTELHHQALLPQQIESFTLYRQQLHILLSRIGRDHPSYPDALLYHHRLSENMQQSERYGDTDMLRADRAKVIERLNSVALAALGTSLHDLLATNQLPSAAVPDQTSDQLIMLDQRLRAVAFQHASLLANLAEWRRSLSPPETAWWWSLDQQFEAVEQERDLPWNLLAAALMIISLAISAEIIRRLWAGAPDGIAIFGTVLTLILSGSPLLQRGPELTQWALRRLRWLPLRFRGEAKAATAGLTCILVSLGWISLPTLGVFYNNLGSEELASGRLTVAEQLFTRAAALNPDLPVPYYNLADTYEASGSPEEALQWYRRSIAHDRLFRPVYYRIGYLYNQQGEYAKAQQILIAGLNLTNPKENSQLTSVTNYMLLSNLGWSLFAQGEVSRAQEVLNEAILLEPTLDADNRQRLPHYYLAQVYCQQQRPSDAVNEIQETLRFGDPDQRNYHLWNAAVNEFLAHVKSGAAACTVIPKLN